MARRWSGTASDCTAATWCCMLLATDFTNARRVPVRWGLISIAPRDLAVYGRALLDRELTPSAARLLRPSARSSAEASAAACRRPAAWRPPNPSYWPASEVRRALEQDLIYALVTALGTEQPTARPTPGGDAPRSWFVSRTPWRRTALRNRCPRSAPGSACRRARYGFIAPHTSAAARSSTQGCAVSTSRVRLYSRPIPRRRASLKSRVRTAFRSPAALPSPIAGCSARRRWRRCFAADPIPPNLHSARGWGERMVRSARQQFAPAFSAKGQTMSATGEEKRQSFLSKLLASTVAIGLWATTPAIAQTPAPAQRPNIVFIMGDDIGWFNIGAYHRGMMAGRTPNLDRLAAQGMLFTDYYAEASCTAGRANFITGQLPIRTGMTTVGQAGATIGMPGRGADDRHGAEVDGLRHRPVRQEPPRRPQRVPADRARLRRVLRLPLSPRRDGGPVPSQLSAGAAGQGRPAQHGPLAGRPTTDDPTEQPRWGKVGKQKIEDAGDALSRSGWRRWTTRSSTTRSSSSTRRRPTTSRSSCWLNPTRMHIVTHLSEKYEKMRNAGERLVDPRGRHGAARRHRRRR